MGSCAKRLNAKTRLFCLLFCAITALFFVDRNGRSGAGQYGKWRRSEFTLLTCARNRPSKRFNGAGPPPQNGPAPELPLTCAVHPTLLHQRPHRPAPPPPETAAIANNRHQNAAQVQTRQGFGPKRRFPQPRLQKILYLPVQWNRASGLYPGHDIGAEGR